MPAPTHADTSSRTAPVSRRTALRAGAVGGALVWSVPLLQIIDMSSASATPASALPPKPGLPSHGFALINCGDGVFAVKIDSGNPSVLDTLGNGNDIPFLTTKGLSLGDGTTSGTYRKATTADKAHIASFGVMTLTGGQQAMFITIGAGCTFVRGYTYVYDGSFGNGGHQCGNGNDFTNAMRDGKTVLFATVCNEPSTGEF